VNLIAATVLAFLPEKYRHVFTQDGEFLARGAFLGGGLEMLAFLGLLIHRYFIFANHWLNNVPGTVVNSGMQTAGETSLMGLGAFVLLGYVLQPLTIVVIYFVAEGAVRIVAAGLSGEIVPSLPLALFALLHSKVQAQREEAQLGPRVIDQVENAVEQAGNLRIASCRPKPDWDDLVTISYQQMLYEVAGRELGPKPRPYIYFLRQRPEYKLIRALRPYHPSEVLKKP
jgi:hypothetical protein